MVEEKANLKYMNIKINLGDILNLGKEEEVELLKMIRDEETIGSQPMKITDVTKKYHLKKLQLHNGIINKVFGSTTTIIVIILVIITAI